VNRAAESEDRMEAKTCCLCDGMKAKTEQAGDGQVSAGMFMRWLPILELDCKPDGIISLT
jgi:hypothetical protein